MEQDKNSVTDPQAYNRLILSIGAGNQTLRRSSPMNSVGVGVRWGLNIRTRKIPISHPAQKPTWNVARTLIQGQKLKNYQGKTFSDTGTGDGYQYKEPHPPKQGNKREIDKEYLRVRSFSTGQDRQLLLKLMPPMVKEKCFVQVGLWHMYNTHARTHARTHAHAQMHRHARTNKPNFKKF